MQLVVEDSNGDEGICHSSACHAALVTSNTDRVRLNLVVVIVSLAIGVTGGRALFHAFHMHQFLQSKLALVQ